MTTKIMTKRPLVAKTRVALQSKTGRDRSRELRLWLVERRDRSWFWRPVLDLQRGPGQHFTSNTEDNSIFAYDRCLSDKIRYLMLVFPNPLVSRTMIMMMMMMMMMIVVYTRQSCIWISTYEIILRDVRWHRVVLYSVSQKTSTFLFFK